MLLVIEDCILDETTMRQKLAQGSLTLVLFIIFSMQNSYYLSHANELQEHTVLVGDCVCPRMCGGSIKESLSLGALSCRN